MIGAIFTQFLPEIIMGVLALFSVGAAYLKGRGDGKTKAKVKDHERASEIRDRVRGADPDEQLRKFDGRGWRD